MLVAFLYLMNNFMGPVNQLVRVGSLLQETEGDMGRIDDVLNYEIANEFDEKTTEKRDNVTEDNLKKLTGRFEMKNVTFGYNKTTPALIEDFSLVLKPGSRIALVGGSGSGKSTVARLASGLYDPWEGDILFDNKLRQDFPRHIITESLAVIDQEVLMFKGTIQENIAFWDSKIPEKHIIQSARDAAIHDVVAARANAYDSEVMERGANFSGGQRQRLEIARALALNPSILIMDEATSALDSKSEKIVMDNIKKRGCTCLIVAHRLSTIMDCDEIIVMEFGKIAERGTHHELLNKNGVYAKLIDSK
jgi:ABC-type bacteriocin/lantibiotic exporter with double-glycine peptidase domain